MSNSVRVARPSKKTFNAGAQTPTWAQHWGLHLALSIFLIRQSCVRYLGLKMRGVLWRGVKSNCLLFLESSVRGCTANEEEQHVLGQVITRDQEVWLTTCPIPERPWRGPKEERKPSFDWEKPVLKRPERACCILQRERFIPFGASLLPVLRKSSQHPLPFPWNLPSPSPFFFPLSPLWWRQERLHCLPAPFLHLLQRSYKDKQAEAWRLGRGEAVAVNIISPPKASDHHFISGSFYLPCLQHLPSKA